MRKSVPASVEPGLKPNQPKARMNVPSTTIGTLWPGIALAVPSRCTCRCAGPSSLRADQGDHAAGHVHDARAGEVDVAVPEAEVARRASTSQPPPHDPVAVDRVDDGAEKTREDAEGRELPALGHGARWGSSRWCP